MQPDSFRDYYADLGLKLGASHDSIKAAFHALAKQHHPDKSGVSDTSAFRRAREAYEKLSDASYRETYDRDYWYAKLHTKERPDTDGGGDEGLRYTRTAQYEQEASRPPSPPPTKPNRKPGEPGWSYYTSKNYQWWQRKDDEHRARHPERNEAYQTNDTPNSGRTAHGLSVQMTHPASQQRCPCRSQYWRVQAGGIDYCIFCMAQVTGGSRCPSCEALACQKCLREVVALEREAFGGLSSKAQYRSSGG